MAVDTVQVRVTKSLRSAHEQPPDVNLNGWAPYIDCYFVTCLSIVKKLSVAGHQYPILAGFYRLEW